MVSLDEVEENLDLGTTVGMAKEDSAHTNG